MTEDTKRIFGGLSLVGILVGLFLFAGGAFTENPTQESYCAEKGADGWAIMEMRCLRRLNAGVCNDPDECRLFAGHRYLPDLDSSLDIRCAGDTGGSHVSDFGTTDCEYIGN